MPTALLPILLITFAAVEPANSEALQVGKNEVIAATIVERQGDKNKPEKASAPEENKDEVKSES